MRARLIASLALVALSATSIAAADAPTSDAIFDCIDILAPLSTHAPAAAGPYCPALVDGLSHHPLAGKVVGVEIAHLEAVHLEDLAALIAHYEQAPATMVFDGGALDRILDELPKIEAEALSPWARFLVWLESWFRDWFEREGAGWLQGIFEPLRMPEGLGTALTILTITLLLTAALFVVLRELREAGWLQGTSYRGAGPMHDHAGKLAGFELDDLERIALERKPAVLLELLIHKLRLAGTRVRPGATLRELEWSIAEWSDSQHHSLSALCRTAENLAYAAQPPRPAEIETAVAAGVSLVESIRQVEDV